MTNPDMLDEPLEGYHLQDARMMNSFYPETHPIPTQEQIDKLRINSFVKLIFVIHNRKSGERSRERMWVKIKSIDKTQFVGILDNHPAHIRDLKIGDTVTFIAANIIAIL